MSDKITLLNSKHILEMLKEINKSPKRFKELSTVSENTFLRGKALKTLKNNEWVVIHSIKQDEKLFTGYKLSTKGKKILNKSVELERLL